MVEYMSLRVCLLKKLIVSNCSCRSIEDTFLLLDALEKDAQSMKMQNPAIFLEIGYE